MLLHVFMMPVIMFLRLKVFNRKQETDEPVATSDYPLHLEVGQKQQRVVLEIPNAKHWSHQSPHLYRLVAQTDRQQRI